MNPLILLAEHLIYPAIVLKIGSNTIVTPGILLFSVLIGMNVSPLS
jgi:hypothetical protein